MRYLVLPLLPILFFSGGCITHTVRVNPAAVEPRAPRLVVTSHLSTTPTTVVTVSRTLPVELHISAWSSDAAGLVREEALVRSPLVWWQRFPFDIVSDLMPHTVVASTTATIAYQPVAAADEAQLTQEAIRHGFAHAPTH